MNALSILTVAGADPGGNWKKHNNLSSVNYFMTTQGRIQDFKLGGRT
jgi:hypothetical protein